MDISYLHDVKASAYTYNIVPDFNDQVRIIGCHSNKDYLWTLSRYVGCFRSLFLEALMLAMPRLRRVVPKMLIRNLTRNLRLLQSQPFTQVIWVLITSHGELIPVEVTQLSAQVSGEVIDWHRTLLLVVWWKGAKPYSQLKGQLSSRSTSSRGWLGEPELRWLKKKLKRRWLNDRRKTPAKQVTDLFAQTSGTKCHGSGEICTGCAQARQSGSWKLQNSCTLWCFGRSEGYWCWPVHFSWSV